MAVWKGCADFRFSTALREVVGRHLVVSCYHCFVNIGSGAVWILGPASQSSSSALACSARWRPLALALQPAVHLLPAGWGLDFFLEFDAVIPLEETYGFSFRGKGGKGRGYYVEEEMGFYYDENDETYYDYDEEAGYYEDSEWPAESYDDWHEDENFDATAVYYQDDDAAGDEAETPFPVQTYDEAYAAYVDARKRFSDLRLSRGFLPVVALSDPSAGNLSPGLSSPGGSPGHGKGKKGGKGKGSGGKGKNIYKYNKPPPKPHETRMRGKALTCLRCGKPGHFAHKTFSSVTGSYGKVWGRPCDLCGLPWTRTSWCHSSWSWGISFPMWLWTVVEVPPLPQAPWLPCGKDWVQQVLPSISVRWRWF